MRNIHPSKLIQSELFVKEPVNKICRDIEKSDIDRMILMGRGIGKSVVLEQMQNKAIATTNPFLLVRFNPLKFSSDIETNPIYTDTFLRHYSEEQMAFQILWYIKKYYEYTYHARFTKYSDYLHESHEKTIQYINESISEKQAPLFDLLSTQEISGEILDDFKKYCYAETIRLGIDRFDWINSEKAQHIFSDYFDLFSSCIITSDDETVSCQDIDEIPEEWYKKNYRETNLLDTFYHYPIDYGKNIEIVKLIFEKRIEDYNQRISKAEYLKNLKPFPDNFFTNEILELIIENTNGNISIMLDILKKLVDEWQWSERISIVDVEMAIKECKGNQLKLQKKKKNNSPKLYL